MNETKLNKKEKNIVLGIFCLGLSVGILLGMSIMFILLNL
jgi:hypothetical protein